MSVRRVVVGHNKDGKSILIEDGPAPAILNAIENATGLCLRVIPATPEVLMDAMLESTAEKAGVLG